MYPGKRKDTNAPPCCRLNVPGSNPSSPTDGAQMTPLHQYWEQDRGAAQRAAGVHKIKPNFSNFLYIKHMEISAIFREYFLTMRACTSPLIQKNVN